MRLDLIKANEVESSHQIKYSIMQKGQLIESNVDSREFFFPRSAFKPLQALNLIKTGAADSFGLDDRHLALACSSHAGQLEHIRVVQEWLRRLKLTAADLVCGAHRPYDQESSDELIRTNQLPSKLHNNCSGKHTGFLSVCRHLKMDIVGYENAEHPFQRLLRADLEEYCGESLKKYAIDGCSIPAPYMSLNGFTAAYDRFLRVATSTDISPESRLLSAFLKHPMLTSGKTEFYYKTMERNQNSLLLKVGAEGVLLAMLPRAQMTLVLKVKDGSERALPAAGSYLLKKWAGIEIDPSYIEVKNRSNLLIGKWILAN